MSALAELQERIQSTNALIAEWDSSLARVQGEAPPSVLANIRSLEKLKRRLEAEFLEVAAQEELEVYRYRIINGPRRITLSEVAESWGKFQDFFGAVYSALTKTATQGKKPPQAVGVDLGYGYSFAGSVGVVVTVPPEIGIYATTPLEDASNTVFDMVEGQALNKIAKTVGPVPIQRLHEWVGVHIKNQAGLGLEWRSQQEIKRTVVLDYPQLEAIRATVADTTTTAILEISGELYAVDTDIKQFKLRGDDKEEYCGTFGDAITPEHAASVPARYRAKIIKTTKIIFTSGEPETELFLDSLNSVDG